MIWLKCCKNRSIISGSSNQFIRRFNRLSHQLNPNLSNETQIFFQYRCHPIKTKRESDLCDSINPIQYQLIQLSNFKPIPNPQLIPIKSTSFRNRGETINLDESNLNQHQSLSYQKDERATLDIHHDIRTTFWLLKIPQTNTTLIITVIKRSVSFFFFLERVRNIWAKVGLGPDPGRQIFVFLTPEWQLQLQTLDRNNQQPTASSQQTTSNNTCLPVNKSSARNAAQQHNHTSCASTSDLFPRLVRFDRMADPNRAHIHHQLGIRPNRINPIKTQFHQKQTIKLIRTINTRLDSVLIHLRSIQPIPVGSPVSIWWTDR